MNEKFKKAASRAKGDCELMQGRTKLTTEEILEKRNGTITITAVGLLPKYDNGIKVTDADGNPEVYAVVGVDADSYYTGGSILTKIVLAWIEDFGGINELNSILSEEAVQVELYKTRTKAGRQLIDVTVV